MDQEPDEFDDTWTDDDVSIWDAFRRPLGWAAGGLVAGVAAGVLGALQLDQVPVENEGRFWAGVLVEGAGMLVGLGLGLVALVLLFMRRAVAALTLFLFLVSTAIVFLWTSAELWARHLDSVGL
jgi:hypothetical protein